MPFVQFLLWNKNDKFWPFRDNILKRKASGIKIMIILHVVPRTVREKKLNINYYYGNILEIKQSGTIVLTINNVLGTIVDNRRVTIIFSVILKLKQCGNKVIVINDVPSTTVEEKHLRWLVWDISWHLENINLWPRDKLPEKEIKIVARKAKPRLLAAPGLKLKNNGRSDWL